MAFYGAIFAVVIVLLIAGWLLKISILKLLDVGALFAIVGQFFGRIGNFINGDVIGDYECAERLRFAVEKGLGMLQK